MLGLPFFVVRENLAEHWSGNEIQTCNLRGWYKVGILNTGCAADFKSKAQFAFGHFGATFWIHTRPEIKAQFGPRYLGAVH